MYVAHAGPTLFLMDTFPSYMCGSEHGWDVTLANEEDKEPDDEDKEEIEQVAEESARGQQQKERMEEVERKSNIREREAEEQENIDKHRDEPPFES